MTRRIRLVVFNEDYWSKGLIYSQNILPLKKLCDDTNSKLELLSFTSLPLLCMRHSAIKQFMTEMRNEGVVIHNLPVLFYPTRLMTVKWFMLPFFYLNVFFYVKFLQKRDKGKEGIIYNCRSYYTSLAFLKFYKFKRNLIFDPRTDWIEEKVNAGGFKIGGWTYRMWTKFEKAILTTFSKSLFISDVFKANILKRHDLNDCEKFKILYNPINYEHFAIKKVPHDAVTFLYTGSLGKWNKLENYLDFFMKYYSCDTNARLIVCTNSSPSIVDSILYSDKFKDVSSCVEVHYNVSYNDLPKYYAQCDFGLQIMSKDDSRVGVKFIEYIAALLTPIVNVKVQGATYLARKYELGVVLDGSEGPQQIYEKVNRRKRISRDTENYRTIEALTDVNKITPLLKQIYFG